MSAGTSDCVRDGDADRSAAEGSLAVPAVNATAKGAVAIQNAGIAEVSASSRLVRGKPVRPPGRQGKREGDRREDVFFKHIKWIGTNLQTMRTAMTTIMDIQKVDRRRDDEMNLLVMMPKGSAEAAIIRQHMMRRWEETETSGVREVAVNEGHPSVAAVSIPGPMVETGTVVYVPCVVGVF